MGAFLTEHAFFLVSFFLHGGGFGCGRLSAPVFCSCPLPDFSSPACVCFGFGLSALGLLSVCPSVPLWGWPRVFSLPPALADSGLLGFGASRIRGFSDSGLLGFGAFPPVWLSRPAPCASRSPLPLPPCLRPALLPPPSGSSSACSLRCCRRPLPPCRIRKRGRRERRQGLRPACLRSEG